MKNISHQNTLRKKTKMKIIFLILGVQNLIIWGLDYKHDYDVWTWIWLATGLVYIILSIIPPPFYKLGKTNEPT
jgi:hypothetical protein